MYNVLWIDDEHRELEPIINEAYSEGILLNSFASLDEGMQELEANYSKYEAVLLDAKFFAHKDDKVNTEDTANAIAARDRINKLAEKKEFEIFMLSGQHKTDPAAIDGSFRKMFKVIYRKGNADDLQKLWLDLKAACERQESVQLRRKYKGAFAICKIQYYLGQSNSILLTLALKNETDGLNVEDLTTMRKMVEDLFNSLRRKGIIPKDLERTNSVVKFLRGQVATSRKSSNQYQIEREEFPTEIAQLLSSITETTQKGSHLLGLDKHLRRTQSNFIVKGLFYQLLGLMEWFKDYLDTQPPALKYK